MLLEDVDVVAQRQRRTKVYWLCGVLKVSLVHNQSFVRCEAEIHSMNSFLTSALTPYIYYFCIVLAVNDGKSRHYQVSNLRKDTFAISLFFFRPKFSLWGTRIKDIAIAAGVSICNDGEPSQRSLQRCRASFVN